MNEIKDRKISIFEIKSERNLKGDEVKVKRYVHGHERLWAYVRELSEQEKFEAKAVGLEQSILFKVNHNVKIKAGQYLEFCNKTYVIKSVDGFEYYKCDLTLRAEQVKTEEYDYEEYNEC